MTKASKSNIGGYSRAKTAGKDRRCWGQAEFSSSVFIILPAFAAVDSEDVFAKSGSGKTMLDPSALIRFA